MPTSMHRVRIVLAGVVAWLLPCVWGPEVRCGAAELTLQVAYGSEKKGWIEAVTKAFNDENRLTRGGRKIVIKLVSRGSGEMFEDITHPEETPPESRHHLVSPAAGAYLNHYNEEEQERLQAAGLPPRPLVPESELLFSSPIVLMVWEDLARKMGWGFEGRNPRWREIFDYAREPTYWQGVAGPGQVFRLGHTHPFYSNSGYHALFLEAYTAGNAFHGGLTALQLVQKRSAITRYLMEVEESVPHYDKSTGDLGARMLSRGRDYLSAVIVYENSVFEYNLKAKADHKPRQVVAVYPEEGTFLSDHPIGAVDRPWVTDEHREAGRLYVNYLLEGPRQVLAAKSYGFRPRLAEFPLSDILRKDLGVDPDQPTRQLKPPLGSVITKLRSMWLEAKRPCDVILAIDISLSMKEPTRRKGETRIDIVRAEVPKFIERFRKENNPSGGRLSLIVFGPGEPELIPHEQLIDPVKGDQAPEFVRNIEPGGDTPLYQAVALARSTFDTWAPPPGAAARRRNRAIVVFSDGQDSRNRMNLKQLLGRIAPTKGEVIAVHTIGFGLEKNVKDPKGFLADLDGISKATRGEFHPIEVDPNAVKKTFEFIIMMY